MFKKVNYKDLNSKQEENYNFHKVSSKLADYGFNSMRLNDDWEGASWYVCKYIEKGVDYDLI